jgi:hypothetical protein
MLGDSREVLVGCEQRKSMLATCGGDQEIDWAGVDSFNATDRSQASRGRIGFSVQLKEGVRVQESEQAVELFCRTESVEEFLENIADQKEPVT